MTLSEQMEIDLQRAFFSSDDFASAATFTDVGGDPVICNVIIDHDVILQPDAYDAQIAEIGTTIDALVSDVGTPRHGATVIVGDTTYTVKRIETNDGYVIKLVVK